MNKAYLVYKHEEDDTKIYYLGTDKEAALQQFGNAIFEESRLEGWPEHVSQNTAMMGVETARNSLGCDYQGIKYMEN